MIPYHFYRKLNIKSGKGGFVALMSAIIISVVLLLLVTNLSLTGFYDRSNILDGELKERSSALAEACADTAILKLANNKDYPLVVPETVPVGGDSCQIISLEPNPIRTFPITIHTQGIFNNIYTDLEIKIDNNYAVTLWQELPHF